MTPRLTLRILALALPLMTGVAQAQVARPLAVRASDGVPAFNRHAQPGTPRRSPYEIPGRVVLGIGGSFAGAFGGALLGANFLYRGNCGCEDPGLGEAVMGAAVGSILLSGIFAGIPNFSSKCSQTERIGRGIGGSLVGAFAGGLVGSAMGNGGELLGYIGGAGLGAGLSNIAC